MSNLVSSPGSAVSTRQSRYTGKALARLDSRTEIGIAEIESQAELQATRVMAVAYVGKRAMHEVAMLSQLEQQLSTLVPMATSRLQAIGDMVALSAADVVADTVSPDPEVIELAAVGLLAVAVVACLTVLTWSTAIRRWEVRAEQARVDMEVRQAERRLHGLASQAFSSMLEATRGHSKGGNG